MRCDLCRYFMRPKAEWNVYVNHTFWDITCIVHGHSFLLIYHTQYFTTSHHLGNTEVISNTAIWHQKCNICGINSFSRCNFSHPSIMEDILINKRSRIVLLLSYFFTLFLGKQKLATTFYKLCTQRNIEERLVYATQQESMNMTT